MPRFPNFANRAGLITGSVFEKYRDKMTAQGENLIKLHIGDTYLPPSYPLPVTKELVTDHPDFNRYCNTFGIAALRDALAVKLQEDNDLAVNRDQILITNGATNALSISMMALVAPGDEVLVLSPAWPFFFGMVRIAGGEILDVPFYTRLFDEPDLDIGNYLSQFVTSSTVALYLNTPNNPSGKVLSREQIEKVADFVREHDLWIVSDEAYDGLTFDGLAHISIATLPEMFDRTLSVFTFSKSFMFAGLRLGYVVAGEEALANLNKMMVHQLYSPSTLAQQMMVEPVKTRREWLPAVR
ncbi:MAG: pyridoxal phosphate-dependent aminotransferase, partial [Pseudomonadales bacterium]